MFDRPDHNRTGGETMTRIPPAARTLIAEATTLDDTTNAEVSGDPDGYGVHRALTFTQAPWLADALEAVEDERIASAVKENEHTVLVTFVGDVRADQAHDFGLDVAYEVLTSVTDEGDAEPDEEEGEDNEYDDDKYDDEGNPRQPRK